MTGLASSFGRVLGLHNLNALGLAVTVGDVFVYAGLALFALSRLPRPEGTGCRTLWPGALLIGLGLLCVHILLAYFLGGRLERAPALDGTLGASTVVLLVLFLIARLLVAAMFLNATIDRLRGHDPD